MENVSITQGRIAALMPADVLENAFYAPPAEMAEAVFSGKGLDDLSEGGAYSGPPEPVNYLVEIDGVGTGAGGVDTFCWSKDGGTTWEASEVDITGSAQDLDNGVTVTFSATTGHTSGDQWVISVSVFEVNAILRIGNQDEVVQSYGVAHCAASGAAVAVDWTPPYGTVIDPLAMHELSIHARFGEYIRVKASVASKITFLLTGQLIKKTQMSQRRRYV